MERGAWWAAVHGVTKSWTQLSNQTTTTNACDFPGGSDGKASAYSEGDLASIPGLGRSPGEGNGNPLPWMEEPGGLQSVWSQRVRHDWATSLSLSAVWGQHPTFLRPESPQGAWLRRRLCLCVDVASAILSTKT